MATTKMRPSTARMYRSYYRNHIGPAIGRVAVVKLNGPALDQFASELMAKESLSESTAARIVSIVAAMLMAARAAHLIDNEPWRDMRNRPVERKGDPRALDSDEVALVVAKAEELHGELYSTLWQTMAHCGFRISEALGLRVQDVDLEDRTIRLQFQLDRDTLKLAELKDGDARTVGLPVKTAALLAELMEGKRPGDLIFTGPSGSPLALLQCPCGASGLRSSRL